MLRHNVYTTAISTVILLLVLVSGAADILTVTAPGAVVRAGPSDMSQILTRVPRWVTFSIMTAQEGWYQVRLEDGRDGWIADAHVRVEQGSLAVAADFAQRSTGPATPRRTALVVGNAAYATAPLRNPVHDAIDMAAALKRLGFEVTALHDAGRREIEEAIEAFSQQLRQGGVGLFYYAGHGVQISGENYLIPVGVRINREQDVKFEAVPVGRILGGMEDAGNDFNIVILDACRDNPFARSFRSSQSGLAGVQAARGSLIAFATSPGEVAVDGTGDNSFYTQHLVQAMTTPGLSIEQVFKQVRTGVLKATGKKQTPWESSSLIGDFYFASLSAENPSVAAEATRPQVQEAPPVVSTRATPTGPDPETVMWALVEQSSNLEDIQDFLRVYPDSRLAPVARLKLKQLQRQQPKETEVAARVSPPEEKKVPIGASPPKEAEVAVRATPPAETKVAAKVSSPKETEGTAKAAPPEEKKVVVGASPPKETEAAVEARPPEETKVAVRVLPPTQPYSSREEIFHELLNFEALDQAKLQMAICSAANTVRARQGLPALTYHPLLEQAAHMHAQRMVSHNFFAHEDPYDPNLRTFDQRARHVGVANPYVHQNIAVAYGIQYQAGETVHVINKSKSLFSRTLWGPPIPKHTYRSFAESVINQWLASPDLSASILSKDVVQMGCGVAFYWDEDFPAFKVVQVYQYFAGIKP
jgi:uncharacterized caspase-like protein